MDPVLDTLAGLDPAYYLAVPFERSVGPQWHDSAALTDSRHWKQIARQYAAGLQCDSDVVGGSCALQGYAWRLASLTIGHWALTGRGLALATEDVRVRLEQGRTTALAVRTSEVAPQSVDALMASLVSHLAEPVEASRAVSRLTAKVAWGNVASSVASAWRRLHDSAGVERRPALREVAVASLRAPAWPWADPPIESDLIESAHGPSLIHRRTTCCLIRLAPDHEPCSSCSILDQDESRRRWRERSSSSTVPPNLEVGAHVGS